MKESALSSSCDFIRSGAGFCVPDQQSLVEAVGAADWLTAPSPPPQVCSPASSLTVICVLMTQPHAPNSHVSALDCTTQAGEGWR